MTGMPRLLTRRRDGGAMRERLERTRSKVASAAVEIFQRGFPKRFLA